MQFDIEKNNSCVKITATADDNSGDVAATITQHYVFNPVGVHEQMLRMINAVEQMLDDSGDQTIFDKLDEVRRLLSMREEDRVERNKRNVGM